MFGWSFTFRDLVRVIWTFVFAFIGAYFVTVKLVVDVLNKSCGGGTCDWSTARTIAVSGLAGAIAAAFSAVKNAALADGSTLKG